MASNQYKLSYTASEIDAKLGKIDNLAKKSDIPTIPDALKNPSALTFTGAVTSSYDGSVAKTVNIPTVPTSLKNPNALNINGKSYDGSKAEDFTNTINDMIDVKIDSKSDSQHNHDDRYYTESEIDLKLVDKADKVHNHNEDYDAKGAADEALSSAKAYADSAASIAASSIKDELLNGAGDAYDSLKELGDLIDENQDAIEALETIASGKADKEHTHTKSQITDFPSSMPNPNALTINGVTYDGSSAVNVDIDVTENATDIETVNALIDTKMRSVKRYGAKGDGVSDDTECFQTALANERVVYVPDGTYILSDTLLIEENCCLELSQDTVLKFIQNDKPCITLLRIAHLKGNHATIIVPYEFNSKVVNCDTRACAEHLGVDQTLTGDALKSATAAADRKAVPPFTHWDPQWKMGRYVTNINICKPNSSGVHNSDDGKCYGTALFIGCYEDDYAQDYMWGVNMSGLRIAGGFTYGTHIYNEGTRWNHDMRLEAMMDACETGVLVENCNIAHLAVVVQPRAAEDGTPFAKHGIKLVDSKWIDLTSSYVWDWTSTNSLFTGNAPACEYQHIAMYGDCSGVNIYDASAVSSNYFWQRIYYDNLASMFNATVHGSKGKIPIDPKYAFYKSYRTGGYDFNNQNLSGRDYHNMVRYDVPVTGIVKNPYSNPNRLYRIGNFTINGSEENPIGEAMDKLLVETVTIEENGYYGLMGWSNIFSNGSTIQHYWCPLVGVYDNRVPVYFYNKSGDTFTIYRLVTDQNDIQHIYNCRVSITNAKRFIFDFADMGAIDSLDTTNTYKLITPALQIGAPKLAGQFALVNSKPVVCTKSATWNANGAISTESTKKQIALIEDIDAAIDTKLDTTLDSKLDSLVVSTENVDFVEQADGEYIPIENFTNVKSPYQENVWCNDSGEMVSVANSIYIEPREFKTGDVIRIQGINFASNYPGKARVVFFNKSDGSCKGCSGNMSSLISTSATGKGYNSDWTYVWDADTSTLTITFDGDNASSFCNAYTYSFGGEYATGYNADSVVMTVNEEIKTEYEWHGEPKRLDESIYAQSVMLKSPNGTIYKLVIDDDGNITSSKIED